MKNTVRGARRIWSQTGGAALSRRHVMLRRHRFTGAYKTRAEALRAAPARALKDYGHDGVASVSMGEMETLSEWDYPVLFWLDHLATQPSGAAPRALLDAGGHVGTKFYAFRDRIDLTRFAWQVYDLPPMVDAGRRLAAERGVDDALTFVDDVNASRPCDILLCSGLLQYLDIPFTDFVNALPARPNHIVLNKVAHRDDETVFTLERIGPAYVPYQIRCARAFHDELDALGYEIIERWRIEALSHVIASHPDLGASESGGYILALKSGA